MKQVCCSVRINAFHIDNDSCHKQKCICFRLPIIHHYVISIAMVGLYKNLTDELEAVEAHEGIPYMNLYGIWARIYVHDIEEFCSLYGYFNGVLVANIRTYGGLIWTGYSSLKCLVENGTKCEDVKYMTLMDEWYDGKYIKCGNSSFKTENGNLTNVS